MFLSNVLADQVPNVKLRPAAVTFKPKPPTEAAWDDTDQTDEIEQMKLGGKRPFRRIVISATGVSDKVITELLSSETLSKSANKLRRHFSEKRKSWERRPLLI